MILRIGLLFVAIAAAVPVNAADQFDLSCMTAKPNKRSHPFLIRIDLAAGEWCIGKCDVVSKVKSVTASTIVLNESDERDGIFFSKIDRLTGEYYFSEERPKAGLLGFWSQKGSCTPQPFTGFGEQTRKF